MGNVDLFGEPIIENELLRDKFLEPPFTILDGRGGAWQQRKKQWKNLGIKSELGRDAECVPASFGGELDANGLDKYGREPMSGTSIFCPALTELLLRWFCPQGGMVLDPFAGGSVRGIVANYLGYFYTGIELRPKQVEANFVNAREIMATQHLPHWHCGDAEAVLVDMGAKTKPAPVDVDLTPVEFYDTHGIWLKRDDFFNVLGARGGKVRTCLALAHGANGIVTAGSRMSPQVNIVAHVAKHLGIAARAHTPQGELSPEVLEAQNAGAEIIQHRAGYNSVIIARAREDAKEKQLTVIPFGMECNEAVEQTRKQVANIPKGVKRIVIPVGSGMSLAGVLHGLNDCGLNIPVLGIVVGANPEERLDKYAPSNWRDMVILMPSGTDYHTPAAQTEIAGVTVDSIYEAKCLPWIMEGDLLWIVGIRKSEAHANTYPATPPPTLQNANGNKKFDFLLTCPPYLDLEVYSDNPQDLSTMSDAQFEAKFTRILQAAARIMIA